ncbi:MAG: hypothetical protein ACTSU5_10335 [Promethearchaeota archaeon]
MSFGGVFKHEYLVLLKKGEKACQLLEEFARRVTPEKRRVLEAAGDIITEIVNDFRAADNGSRVETKS